MKGFWAAVAYRLRLRMGVRVSAFVACLLVVYAPAGLPKLVAMLLAVILGYIMFVYDYGIFAQPFVTWWKLRGKVTWEPPPSYLSDLAEKMHVKLNKKRPFGVTDLPIGAAANMSYSRIIVERNVLVFPEGERNAVLAHELAHLRPKQVMTLMLLMYFVMLGVTPLVDTNPIIMSIAASALFLILRTVMGWSLEYDADKVGASFSSPEALASALRHLVKPEKYDDYSDTHPSVNTRVARLLAPQEPLWTRLSSTLLRMVVPRSFCEEFLASFIQDLKEHSNTIPKYFRPVFIAIELIKAALMWG